MTAWLDPLRGALDGASAPVQVFFRDDDAGWDDDGLLRLLDVFACQETPIDVAAIPAALGPSIARSLADRRGVGVRVHQHGFAHANHEAEGRKCEFGRSRSLRQRLLDLSEGQRRLKEMLGDGVDPVFTPPWNRCEPDIADHLVRAGITVLSRDRTAPVLAHECVREVPVNFDWFGATRGVRWKPADLGNLLAARVSTGEGLGVMLHHAVSSGDDRRAIAQLVELVRAHPLVACTTIREIARC